MSEETNVLSGGKVVKAKEVYKNFLNSDGTWRKGVTESQKQKIIGELDKTYELQKSYRIGGYNSKEEAEKIAILLGGKASDVESYVSVSSKDTGAIGGIS